MHSHLLMSVLERIADASDDLGGRYSVVDATDDAASSFYMHHGFEAIDSAQGRLVLPIKDIREAMARYRP